MIAVDVGAHKGKYIDSRLGKSDRIYAFEPHPILCKNLRRKYVDSPKVVLVEAACWSWDGHARLFLHRSGNLEGSSLIGEKANVGTQSVLVRTVHLGNFLEDKEQVSEIKIDAEGAEWSILLSLLWSNLNLNGVSILIEDHSRKIFDTSWRRVRKRVKDLYEQQGLVIGKWH